MSVAQSEKFSGLILAVLVGIAGLSACGKEVSIFEKSSRFPAPKPPACGSGVERLTWQFFQPEAEFNRSVDLLFVTDASLSLHFERRKLARAISHFLRGLPEGADPRIAVMLGHGGKSKWSGRLFYGGKAPRVLDPTQGSEDEIASQLEDRLTRSRLEWASTNGEALFLSLQKSLTGERFNEIRSQGFFRDGAALSVVFVADENEVCFDPRQHGMTSPPDFKDSLLGLEDRAIKKYCGGITPQSTLEAIRSALPGRKITFGAVVHSEPQFVGKWGEDSIGHGYLQLASQLPDSIVMDIRSGDFDSGLARLASVSTSQVLLQTRFELKAESVLDSATLAVFVDGRAVQASLIVGEHDRPVVALAGQDAGTALSQIDISICPAISLVTLK
jgi:hypothetical protein